MYSPQNQLSDLLSKPSEKESLKWYTMGAKAGHAMCQNDLGTLYKRKGDYATSIKWIRKAAEQNVPLAQFNMGQRYIFGHGVPKSFPEAMVWFRRAADGGECKAQNSLGIMYRDGEGLPERRPAEAAKWFKKGAKPRLDLGDLRMTDDNIAYTRMLDASVDGVEFDYDTDALREMTLSHDAAFNYGALLVNGYPGQAHDYAVATDYMTRASRDPEVSEANFHVLLVEDVNQTCN